MPTEYEELNNILAKKPAGRRPKKQNRNDNGATLKEGKKEDKKEDGKLIQWTTPDGIIFIPAGRTCQSLDPGVYDIQENPNYGIYFNKLKVNTSKLIKFPDSKVDKVVSEITKFWERKSLFKDREGKSPILYKRGIVLWGPPGSGKSSLTQLIVQDVIEKRDGVCVVFGHPRLFLSGMRLFRQIHPDKKVVVLMEDLDSILEQHDESEVLNILDGVNAFEDVVFLATTNYPERLEDRVINRPSRFDKRIKIDHPNDACRKMYLESLFTQNEIDKHKINVDKWVKDTKNFSLAHLKELFTAVIILDDKYDEAVKTLRSMKSNLSSDGGESVGFGGSEE